MLKRREVARPGACPVDCAAGAVRAQAQDGLVVFAAASLKNALDEIATRLGQGHRQAGAQDLLCRELGARQADRAGRAGRPVHLGRPRLDGLCRQEEPDQGRHAREPLGNKIVLIAPKDSRTTTSTIKPGFDLAKALAGGKLAMANVDAVPAGKYGKAALEKLGAWDGVKDNVAQAENVRAALLLVARGEAPLGIVYATDAAAEPNVRIVGDLPRGFPSADHLSGGGDQGREVGRRQARSSTYLQERQGAAGVREAGLHGSGEVRHLDMTAEEWTAVRLSLLVAVTATAASLPFGIAVAWLLARGRFWGKSLVDTLVHLPLIMPPVVTGYLLLILFGKRGPIGAFLDQAFGIVFSFRWTGAALACAVMGFPLMVRAIRLSIEAVDTRLESGGRHAGRQPALGVRHHHPAALPARRDRRRDPVLRQGDGRVRRHHHLRVEHPGRDADPAVGDLHPHPDSGRRCRRVAADRGVDRDLDGSPCSAPSCWRAASAPGTWRHEPRHRHRARARQLPARRALHGAARRDGAVRPLGLGQDHAWSTSSPA